MPGNNEFVEHKTELRNLGSSIRSHREMRGLDPDELGKAIGLKVGEIAEIEAGLKDFTFLLFLSLSKVLEISPTELLR